MNSYGIIILAAGDSDRLGYPKQLLEYDGESFIGRTIRLANNLKVPIVTVLGAEYNRVENEVKKYKTDITFNLDWKKGVGTSINHGFINLHKNYPDVNAIIILNCDQPYLDQELLSKLIEEHKQGHQLVVSSSNGSLGVPALIGEAHFKELLKLKGQTGLELLAMALPVKEVAFPLGAVDIDTEEDWKLFFSQSKNSQAS